MASALRTIKYLFLTTLGSIVGMAIAIIMRPSYPTPPQFDGDVNKPSVYMMIVNGFANKTPTDRQALIYLISGLVLGAVAGLLLSRLTTAKRSR
jgi:hypothetical protein